MKKKLAWTDHILAIVSLLTLVTSCILFFIPILFLGLLKLIPVKSCQSTAVKGIDKLATAWCAVNNSLINALQFSQFSCKGLENIQPNDWNLVIANHQSWLDIVVLQHVFNKKIPVLKFFIKDPLKWIPLLGFAWWAMGCPFMKRYTKEYLAKNPHKQGKDIQSTLKAIEQFKESPVSVMNFVEGTRFTRAKQEKQQSPYQHLLKPKAGGIGFVISALGEKIDHVLDVTIIYSNPDFSLWNFMCRRIDNIHIVIREIPIPAAFKHPQLVQDHAIFSDFKDWLNDHWIQKDLIVQELKGYTS